MVPLLNRTELIPGYMTVDRIGAGGYGEVWKVRAPGGLDKAIKVIYGYINEERAARELRALNRIKEIRYPLLLSLERIEIVANQLLIVTELADRSLMDRFQECTASGQVGVPRNELLRYLQDAAAALDYMLEAKGLQHLDIKPENLLLVGDRVKVADFGLVRELADQGNTVMGGLTPVYASPEVFAGCASPQSDQYSLAVVFQQMLTGVLPFPGRTQQQLAVQHKQASPRLTSLSESDRAIVARALSKDPAQRFPSCRDFVDALVQGMRRSTSTDYSSTPANDQQGVDAETDRDHETTSQEHLQTTVVKPIESRRQSQRAETLPTELLCPDADQSVALHSARATSSDLPPVRVVTDVRELDRLDVQRIPVGLRPTLILAIGGTGARVLQALKKRLDSWGDLGRSRVFQLLLLDTNRDTIQEAREGIYGSSLGYDEVIHLGLRRAQEYQARSAEFLKWTSRRWLYNIPRSLQTEGYRPLGRLAWVDHAEKVCTAIRDRLARVIADESIQMLEQVGGLPCLNRAPRVILVGSTAGGTAGGMMLDVEQAVHSSLAELGLPDDGICTILTHSTNGHPRESTLAVANTYAFLCELQHLSRTSSSDRAAANADNDMDERTFLPRATTYFVNLGEHLSEQVYQERIAAVADYLYCNTATGAGTVLDQSRSLRNTVDGQDLYLRSFGVSSLETARRDLPADWIITLSRCVIRKWLEPAEAGDESKRTDQDRGDAGGRWQPDADGQSLCDDNRKALRSTGPPNLEGLWQPEFGEWAQSRFVALLKQLLCHEQSQYRNQALRSAGDFTHRWASMVAEVARQFRDLVSSMEGSTKPHSESSAADKVAVEWSWRSPKSCGSHTVDRQLRAAIPALAEELATTLPARFLGSRVLPCGTSAAVSEPVPSLADLLRVATQSSVVAAINRLDDGLVVDEDGVLFPTSARLAECFDSAAIRLPGCGFFRRRFMVDGPTSHWREQHPIPQDVTLVSGPVDETIIWQEAEQISLAQLAHRLTAGRPEAVEAATRLHSRIDIQWTFPPPGLRCRSVVGSC